MTHIMVDLETMGNRPDAPIVAIGAVAFDSTQVHADFYINVCLRSAVDDGRAVVDPDTVMWWLKQGDAARNGLVRNPHNIGDALTVFSAWFSEFECEGVWGNGASFDNVILSEAYKRLRREPPWPFWLDRCYRTVRAMSPHIKIDRYGTYHNALDDARSQAHHLIKIWQEDTPRGA